MIKLQDFARERGVTDRAIQKHLKKYEKELEGLFERKGPNGTWLTEEACAFLRSHMKSNPVTIVDDRAEEMKAEIARLKQDLAKKDESIKVKDVLIDRLQIRVEERDQKLIENEKKLLTIEMKTEERIQQAVKDAEEKLKNDLQAQFNQQLIDAKNEAAEQTRKEAVEHFTNMGLFKKLFGKW